MHFLTNSALYLHHFLFSLLYTIIHSIMHQKDANQRLYNACARKHDGSTTEGVVYMIIYSRAQCRILLVYLTIIIYKCEYSNLCGSLTDAHTNNY